MDFEEMNQLAALTQLKGDQNSDVWYRSDMMRATEKIIEDDVATEHLKDFPFWIPNSKSLKLTFLDSTDAAILTNLFEAEVCKYLRSVPASQHTPDLYVKIGQMRMLFMLNIRRSVGTENRDMINERTTLQSQFKQIVTSSTGGMSKGLLQRIFGK